MSRDLLFKFLKILFSVALIYWMVQRGFLDMEELGTLLLQPPVIVAGLVFAGANIFFSNWRWVTLLRGQGFPNKMIGSMPLTLIGYLFNFAIPGSVSGDLVKAYYIAKDNPMQRVKAATTVLMDRVVGFYAMMWMAMVAILFNFELLAQNHSLQTIALFLVSGIGGFSVFVFLAQSQRLRRHPWVEKIIRKSPGGQIIDKIYDALHSYRDSKNAVIGAFLISFFSQGIAVACIYYLGEFVLGHGLSITAYFFAVPVGLIISAAPISPGGVGVGQVAFMYLFNAIAQPEKPVGPVEISIFQISLMAYATLGAIFYLQRKKNIPTAMSVENSGEVAQ